MQEDPADPLEMLANPLVAAAETAPGERCLLGRDPEEAVLEPATDRLTLSPEFVTVAALTDHPRCHGLD